MSDEEWERFLQESVDGTSGAPKEPSARARIVARRLRENPGEPEPWRTYSPAAPRRRRRTARYAAGLTVCAALLAVALFPDRVTGWFGGGATTAAGEPLPAETERPTQPPPTGPAQRPTPDEPFRGSPAERWASGADGIALPGARATGWMSTAQVGRALERTRDFLAASNLDPGVLRGERPARAIALINPRQRDTAEYLSAAFRAPDEKNDPLLLFTRFDSDRVRPVGDEVRTRGRVTYEEGDRGALRVTTDVTYVYPVTRVPDGGEVVRTIVRREVVLEWNDPAKVITKPGTFSLVSYSVDTTNGGCGAVVGLLTPEFGGRPAGVGEGPAVDPYDRGTSMAELARTTDGEECGAATRS
ncbi:hypothetical protein [Streptomyces clavuligerus]|uniref:Putative membrane protein n=1 Tax=Streptomyces clavuligerus TaxID=1901 RepID=E2Q5T5_STRCL|nr:hypothetical protein [Streptomyces clavuligerus]ANW22130.1 hypothetical protein BB341_27620 [Streptomyces clavuligerus]AXU16776.1 hypothetical protein D1794_28695 [Streptomyces clavuligerus]EFG05095.1 Putative membrane protein [Streptomyces clavuligerus]MBY6306506.1 hypothetical protein [Streptomyces clavuligerus]QCS09536.1 hypothetical protein CRV15_28050 [Streptomyces clavuligerus]